jgi:predicted HAD superfamily phosphohydrolase YqeG
MAGMMGQHWLQPDWDPGLTIAHLALSHLTAQGIEAAVLDVDRTLLPGRDVKLPEPVLAPTAGSQRLPINSMSVSPQQRESPVGGP